MTDKGLKRFAWLKECWEKEIFLQQKISKNLKENWEFFRLPPLEKAILIYATHELFFGSSTISKKMLLDQIINFSKVYLEEGKHKYINKNLDLSWKDLSSLNFN
jgi:transcription termination factor NusB